MINFLKACVVVFVGLILVACGGGGGSSGSSASTTTTTVVNTVTLKVSDFVISTDKVVLNSAGVDNIVVTVVALDTSRNIVVGSDVKMTVDKNAVLTPVGTAVTDTTGSYAANLTVGSDKSDRTLTIQVTVNGIVKNIFLQVSATPIVAVSAATLKVTDFVLYTDKNLLKNNGTDKVVVTAVALDASRNIVVGSDVRMTVDQNAVLTPVGSSTTDATGSYAGAITIGSDKSDRSLIVQATINGIVKRTSVQITGSKLSLQISPLVPLAGQVISVLANLLDFSGNAIPNAKITLGGDIPAFQGKVILTDSFGSGTTTLAAPSVSGGYTINASGSGVVSVDYPIRVTVANSNPIATIPSGITPSLAAAPNVLSINSPGSSSSKSTLRFLMLDSLNAGVPNVRVKFKDITTGLPLVGASISPLNQIVYTNESGVATAQYIAGQNTSPTNGVFVRACYSAIDFISDSDCPQHVDATLTVAGQSLAVSIGDDNLLTKGSGGATYIKKFVVTVADSAGKAIANAPVDISVDLTHYAKSLDYSLIPAQVPPAYTPTDMGILRTPPSISLGVWCPNEDQNRNGFSDPAENIDGSVDGNGQATLQPRKSDLIISYVDPAVTSTNASGILLVQIEYSQRFARWLAYTVRVTANVGGSQGTNERRFVTNFVEGDQVNGSFLFPPYGTNSCAVAN